MNEFETGKAVIPYEMKNSFDSLWTFYQQTVIFFKRDFYRTLKNTIIADEEYGSVKKFCTVLKMRNLKDPNVEFSRCDYSIRSF